VYEKILKGKQNQMFPAVPVTSKSACDAMRKFLTRDRRNRAGCGRGGFKTVKNLGFFSGTSWESATRQLLEPPLVPSVEMDGDSSNYDFFPEETVEEPSNLTTKQRELFNEFDEILARPRTS
jgi:protein kinase A